MTALAVTRPFHLVEHGTLTVDRNGNLVADGTGTATHLGRFALHRAATLKPTMEGELEVDGQATLTAANGHELEASIKGTLDPQTGQAVLIYEWKGGAGRFQNASGEALGIASTDPHVRRKRKARDVSLVRLDAILISAPGEIMRFR